MKNILIGLSTVIILGYLIISYVIDTTLEQLFKYR
jgi:hypothetical protein